MTQYSSSSVVGYCSSSQCGAPIYPDHKAINCTQCGLLLPQDLREQLPELQKQGDLSTAIGLGIIGAIIGAIIGFLFRPAVPLVGQLDLMTVLSRGSNLSGVDRLLVSVAESSFNYLMLGAAIGGVVGLIGGFMYASTSRETKERLAKQIKEAQVPKTANHQSNVARLDDGDTIGSHLKLLAELKNDGVLTEEEFQQKKKELLSRL